MKFINYFILFFVIICFSSALIAQDAEEYIKKAEEKIEKQDYQYAMVLIDKALAINDTNIWYYLLKADVQFKLTGPKDALGIINQAIEIDNQAAEPYNRAGIYLESGGVFDLAIEMYDYAISLATNDSAKHSYIMNRGVAKTASRNFEGAVEDFETVVKFNPNDIGNLNNIAMCYSELNDNKKSIETLKRILDIDSLFIGPYVNLGFIYSSLDSFDVALKYFDKAVEMDPNSALALNNRGYAHYKKKNYAQALKDINKSIETYPTNAYAYRNLALVYIAQKNKYEACQSIERALELGYEKRYGNDILELKEKNCSGKKSKKKK